jgi:hypothetical protein
LPSPASPGFTIATQEPLDPCIRVSGHHSLDALLDARPVVRRSLEHDRRDADRVLHRGGFLGDRDIRPLFLKKVLQEAFVNVDEVGTEAVTAVVAATVSLTGVAARGRKKAANP